MWRTWADPNVSHGFRNFEVAAGTVKGEHKGPPFHDGDMYKWLEGAAAIYGITHDKRLDQLMDSFITRWLLPSVPTDIYTRPWSSASATRA